MLLTGVFSAYIQMDERIMLLIWILFFLYWICGFLCFTRNSELYHEMFWLQNFSGLSFLVTASKLLRWIGNYKADNVKLQFNFLILNVTMAGFKCHCHFTSSTDLKLCWLSGIRLVRVPAILPDCRANMHENVNNLRLISFWLSWPLCNDCSVA